MKINQHKILQSSVTAYAVPPPLKRRLTVGNALERSARLLILPPEETSVRLGKWGLMHKEYLLKHKKVFFTTLLTQGKLYQHCAKIENQAKDMFDTLVEQMKTAEGVTEQLKEENQLEWICRIQNIEARAREIVYSELVCK